jgi:hypothetical protein
MDEYVDKFRYDTNICICHDIIFIGICGYNIWGGIWIVCWQYVKQYIGNIQGHI